MIPKIEFLGVKASRLALGDNPFNGHSYIPETHSGSEMMDYYSEENTVRTMLRANELGINTYIGLGDPHVLRVLRQLALRGGKMHTIFQFYPPIPLEVNIPMMLGARPLGIYHQGTMTDLMVEEGQVDKIRDNIRRIKDAGVYAGLGSHVPETIMRAEEEDWGAQFYMTCLYNTRKSQRGQQSSFITGKPKHTVFYPGDPYEMFKVIQAVHKPCIAFKLFAGGQRFSGIAHEQIPDEVEAVFTETYRNIKPIDIACIGVLQKYKDQLRENVEIANRVLRAL